MWEVKYFCCVCVRFVGSGGEIVQCTMQAHFFIQMTQFSLLQVLREKSAVHSSHLRRGKEKKKNKQKSKCIVVYWEINYLKEMRFQGTDEMNVAMMLQPYCFSIAFFRLWSPCDTSSPSLPLCGNTELRVNDWVNCGVPIGTLVVVGMTGVVHCRRRWEVRCMKEWEAREL